MQLREIVSGRSASAWRRRCARGTAWLGDLSAASAWLADRDPLDVVRWNAPPFGTCLAELTNAVFDYATASAAAQAAPGLRTTSAGEHTSRPGTPRAGASSVRDAGSDDRGAPASRRHARRPSIRNAPISHPSPPPRLLVAAITVSHARLALLAGDVAPAVPPVGTALRLFRGHHSSTRAVPSATAAGIAGIGSPTMPDVAASTITLKKCVNARVERTLSRASGPASSQPRRPVGITVAAGWEHPIAEPEPHLVLIEPDSPIALTASTPTPRPPSATWPTEPAPARRTPPASVPGDRAATRNVAADEEPARLDPPLTAPSFRPLTALRHRDGFRPPVAAPLSVAESRAEERHRRFDPVEFAEYLRVALVEDARRHGIEV